MTKISITGVGGKMGAAILKLAFADLDIQVVGATEENTQPVCGKPLKDLIGPGAPDIIVSSNPREAFQSSDVIIDFTSPAAAAGHFELARSLGKAIVIGTTGLNTKIIKEIENTPEVRVVMSPNMSIGVNVMFDMVKRLSGTLGDSFDVEIVEMHHKWKKDAPSGTALRLRDMIEKAQPERSWTEIYGREGNMGTRNADDIGIMSLRGGDVVGEHTVIFAGIGERLEVTHRALTRENFAQGALVAAKWLVNQKPGIYSMMDVLGL